MANQRPFRFGVVNERTAAPDVWIAHVRRVEACGFSTFLIRDHFAPDYFGDQFAPFAALTTAAHVTTTLRVGSLVFDNDYRHPVLLAKEAATLDLLAGGRLELGVGAGWLQSEYAQAGMSYDPPSIRISRLTESIAILKGLFAEPPLTFAGAHYTVTNLSGFPKPAQRPHPPILIGAGQKRMLMLAGREANSVSILTTSVATGRVVDDPHARLSDRVAQQVAWVREGAGQRFDTVELNLMASVIITDRRRARTEEWIQERGWSGITAEQVWDMPAVLIGSENQIVEDLERRREQLGFSYYVVSDRLVEAVAPLVARLAGS
jgi:probable F420-dependent oxidoreductase